MFKDDLREEVESVVEYFLVNPYNLSEPSQLRLAQALSAITKLVEGLIGSDMGSTGYAIEEYGYNNAKQEIRQRLNSSNEQKEGK